MTKKQKVRGYEGWWLVQAGNTSGVVQPLVPWGPGSPGLGAGARLLSPWSGDTTGPWKGVRIAQLALVWLPSGSEKVTQGCPHPGTLRDALGSVCSIFMCSRSHFLILQSHGPVAAFSSAAASHRSFSSCLLSRSPEPGPLLSLHTEQSSQQAGEAAAPSATPSPQTGKPRPRTTA